MTRPGWKEEGRHFPAGLGCAHGHHHTLSLGCGGQQTHFLMAAGALAGLQALCAAQQLCDLPGPPLTSSSGLPVTFVRSKGAMAGVSVPGAVTHFHKRGGAVQSFIVWRPEILNQGICWDQLPTKPTARPPRPHPGSGHLKPPPDISVPTLHPPDSGSAITQMPTPWP